MSEQMTLQLPYEEITEMAGIHEIRKWNNGIKRGNKESIMVPFELLGIRDGFNARDEEDYSPAEIKEIADSMFVHGQLEPLYVDILKDGRILIERGHIRYHAMKLIRETYPNGVDHFNLVECFMNKSKMTELQRLQNLESTNMHSKPLKPLQRAKVAYRIKFMLGEEKTNKVVAQLLGISRQTADNLITIASQPDDIKLEIKRASMGLRAALDFIKNQSQIEGEADKVEELSLKTYSGPLADAPDPLKKEMKELAEMKHEKTEEEWEEILEQQNLKRKAEEEKELERLLSVSIQVPLEAISTLILEERHRLSKRVLRTWNEDFVDEDTGEVVTIERNEILIERDTIIDEADVQEIVNDCTEEFIYIYKSGCYIPPVPKEKKSRKPKEDFDNSEEFDESREEIQNCNKVIANLDKIENIAKDLPAQTKLDISNLVEWSQRSMEEIRKWISKIKKY